MVRQQTLSQKIYESKKLPERYSYDNSKLLDMLRSMQMNVASKIASKFESPRLKWKPHEASKKLQSASVTFLEPCAGCHPH